MAMTNEARDQANQTFELRIEFGLGDEVPLTVFARSLDDVKAILNQIAADLTHGSAHITWLLRIAPVIQVTAHVNGVGPDVLRNVVGESFQSIVGTRDDGASEPAGAVGEKAA